MEPPRPVGKTWGKEVNDVSHTPRGFLSPAAAAADSGLASQPATAFCGYPSPSHFIKDLRAKLVDVVGTADKLPQGEMNYLVCTTYPDFVEKVSLGTSQITAMMKNLSHYWGVPAATCRQFQSAQNKAAILQGIQETTKQLKERMDLTLDELARLKDEQTPAQNQIVPGAQAGKAGKARFTGRTTGIARPQVAHGWKIDNSRAPFRPLISVKHNALRSLELSLVDPRDDGRAPHPYQFELDLFEPEESRLASQPAVRATKTDDCPFSYIDRLDEFQRALMELSSAKELAVDLEHHSYRTYLGITCLVQISTRKKDYVIDCIALRNHIHELNMLFTNPSILKVFHGGNMDIQWLQRDFGIYVVNMFDTGQASRVLELPRFSLAFLVQHYLGRIIDKTHQTSDWRIRPIPDDMLDYARSDTHDLLYLYDCLRNDLVKKDISLAMLRQVYVQSKEICLQRYEKQTTDVNDFAFIMGRFSKNFSEQQKFALKRILEWRDEIARDLDESIGFVLSTKACVDLAEELPRTADDLVKALEFVPVVVKQRIHQVLELLKEARAFTGIVPVPTAQNQDSMAMDVDSAHEVIQRKIVRPMTADGFGQRHLDRTVPPRTSHLVWQRRDENVTSRLQEAEKVRLAHVWMHFQTVSLAEEEAEKAKPASEVEKPNVKVSVPLELPLAEAAVESTKAKQAQPRKAHQPVTKQLTKAADSVNSTPGGPSNGAASSSSQNDYVRAEAATSSSDVLELPSKRATFDYHSADYSKFAVGAGPAQKRHAGKQHPGGLKDPNKRFNQQRNMTGGSSRGASGGGSRFRKPE